MRSSDARRAPLGLRAAAWAVVAFLHVPLALIVLYAFSAEDQSYVFPPPDLTTRWFAVAWNDRPDVWRAIRLSFEVASYATALLYTTTTQKVACPSTMVQKLNGISSVE